MLPESTGWLGSVVMSPSSHNLQKNSDERNKITVILLYNLAVSTNQLTYYQLLINLMIPSIPSRTTIKPTRRSQSLVQTQSHLLVQLRRLQQSWCLWCQRHFQLIDIENPLTGAPALGAIYPWKRYLHRWYGPEEDPTPWRLLCWRLSIYWRSGLFGGWWRIWCCRSRGFLVYISRKKVSKFVYDGHVRISLHLVKIMRWRVFYVGQVWHVDGHHFVQCLDMWYPNILLAIGGGKIGLIRCVVQFTA